MKKEKMAEGEFNPSKDVPDILENGDIMTVFWTVQGGKPYTFVVLEEGGVEKDGATESDEYDFVSKKPRIFKLFGAIHGKVYPWQVALADLTKRLVRVTKARSFAAAQVVLFEAMQDICDKILQSRAKGATLEQKAAGWKCLAHIETLYDSVKMKAKWFTSKHAGTIERAIDGLLTPEEMGAIAFRFDGMQHSRRLLWKSRRKVVGQVGLF